LTPKPGFQLREQLGAGTVGVVYRAESPQIGFPVAVKLLHPSLAGDEPMVRRFEREVHVLERLDHPHIVRHFGGGKMDGQYFYAMELLDHGTLKERLRQEGALPWQQVAAYGAQIASALQHAHNHGVIHRDVKPSNLFFADDGRLVLGDFGIALDVEEADRREAGTTVGTYSYMSPEQIRGDESITGSADIYSLGCVLYEMLTGRPPFAGATPARVWDQHLETAPRGIVEQRVNCPLWLERLVLQMLAKSPRDRPFNARTVQGILRQHLLESCGSGYQHWTLGRWSPPRHEPLRLWPLWLAIGAAAAGVVLANWLGVP
jgi:serine/threonine protein kinase